jgi:hypothetical protein
MGVAAKLIGDQVPGAAARFGMGFNVQAKAWTYLRGGGNGRGGFGAWTVCMTNHFPLKLMRLWFAIWPWEAFDWGHTSAYPRIADYSLWERNAARSGE